MSIPSNSNSLETFISSFPGIRPDNVADTVTRLQNREVMWLDNSNGKIGLIPNDLGNGKMRICVQNETTPLRKAAFIGLTILTLGILGIVSLFWKAPIDYFWGKTWTKEFENNTSNLVNQVAQPTITQPNQAPPIEPAPSPSASSAVTRAESREAFNKILTDERLRKQLEATSVLKAFWPRVPFNPYHDEILKPDHFIVTDLSAAEVNSGYGTSTPCARFTIYSNNSMSVTQYAVVFYQGNFYQNIYEEFFKARRGKCDTPASRSTLEELIRWMRFPSASQPIPYEPET